MPDIFSRDFKAWSCDMSLEIIRPDSNPEAVLKAVQSTLDFYEAQFSRFQPKSLVSRLNAGEVVTLTPELETLIPVMTAIAQSTSHFFNPHVNLAAHGYDSSFEGQQFSVSGLNEVAPPFPDGLILTDNTVQLKPNIALDFGGFLKGYLGQHLAETHQSAGQGIIVNLGGDLSVRGQDLNQDSFEISIYNPVTKSDEPILLKHQSLSTSGTYKRRWELNGETFHHLLDPFSSQNPDSDFVSVSVFGPSGAQADAFATALFAMDAGNRKTFIEAQSDFNFLMIDQHGHVTRSL